ncbi:MAG: sugar phosphate isomerase/epimerase family protein [Rhizobiaceae bacterium]
MDNICFNQITNYRLALPDALALYDRFDVRWASLWHEKIEQVGVAETKSLLRDHGVKLRSICGWYRRKRTDVTFEDRCRTIEVAAELEAQMVTVLPPGMESFGLSLEETRKRAFDYTAKLLDVGRRHGIALSLEPIHPKLAFPLSSLNTISQAIEWCERLGPGTGIELDVNNIWWDPDLERQVLRAGQKNLIFGVQLCDVPVGDPVIERAALGEGIADLRAFTALIRRAGHRGLYEIELISPALWERDDENYMRDTLAACRDLLA